MGGLVVCSIKRLDYEISEVICSIYKKRRVDEYDINDRFRIFQLQTE